MRSAPTDGRILLDGEAVQFGSPREALDQGVAFIAQELALAPDMTVMENVYMGVEPRHGSFVDRGAMRSSFDALLASSGFEVPGDARVRSLSIADRQKVEILRALCRGASVIIMDEPTSSLTRDESQRLHALIRDLRAGGMTIVYVSHFLEEVLALSDDDHDPAQRASHPHGPGVGRDRGDAGHRDARPCGIGGLPAAQAAAARRPPLLEVDGLRRAGFLHDVSLTVAAGEIVGLAGLVGSGRSELARAIFGADPIDERHDHDRRRRSCDAGAPHRSFEAGIALLPESRKEQGLLLDQPVAANTTLPFLGSSRADRPVRLAVEGQRARRRPHPARRSRREARLAQSDASRRCRVATSRRSCSASACSRSPGS